ncbi:ATP phosphoribosyltransferase 2, chloroplastic-like [Zingiber officinale]|uniref:ATP phosphoribosyltransferase 2, chloroplastic-like n=1 Tax=Zingiber officinale TaxID=94328 RepID=UPI001C4B3708|nr:ATP phosphoribosyltransferase 2, chloroplastic-like [Zingiber officinale]
MDTVPVICLEQLCDAHKSGDLEVWFQRPKDIVRKIKSGDLDLGIVGYDIVCECGEMGTTDAILDLVSSGMTLAENNLKEIKGGVVLESQAVRVASRRSLNMSKGALEITHEMLERLEAHLRAIGVVTVVANMRGNSAEEVAERVLSQPSLSGLQGPTVSPVFCKRDGKVVVDFFAIIICVLQMELYKSVQQLRAIGGSGVLVSDLTYIFEEETPRWRTLLSELGL